MTDTKSRILDVAERLTQTTGFNGFSYIDLADEIGIKTSSIHYHYKTKADLAFALVERTHALHAAAFSELQKGVRKPEKRLELMVDSFRTYVEEGKFCLCGMLAAELQSVSSEVKSKLQAYFDDMQQFVSNQFRDIGHKDFKNRALSFVSALEGALLLARLNGDASIVQKAMKSVKA